MSSNVISHRPTLFRLLVAVAFLAASVAVLGVTPQAAEASIYNGSVIIDCTGWIASGSGSHILDRDNTGAGRKKSGCWRLMALEPQFLILRTPTS